MSKLSVDQKTIYELLTGKKVDFLIPDYQRPYAWDEEQCQTLWDDIFLFSFPDKDYEAFDDNEEYFLGSIVMYKNEDGKSEVIDGQQRLTTLMLILRAFYDKFANMQVIIRYLLVIVSKNVSGKWIPLVRRIKVHLRLILRLLQTMIKESFLICCVLG